MHFVQAKRLLSKDNGMNIYRGCSHGCIYCDSRSRCYGFTHAFEDIEVKENAPELLEKALRSKRQKCMCKGLSAPFAGPCTLPVNIGAEYLVGGQNRPSEVLAQQRIGNHLRAHAALAVVQRQAVAAIIVGAQPPDQPVTACPLGGHQALNLIQLSSPPSPSHS